MSFTLRWTTRTWPKASLSRTVIVAVTFLPLRAALPIVLLAAAAAFGEPRGRSLSVAERPAAIRATTVVRRIGFRAPAIVTVPVAEATTAPPAAVTFVAIQNDERFSFWWPERVTVVVATGLGDGAPPPGARAVGGTAPASPMARD